MTTRKKTCVWYGVSCIITVQLCFALSDEAREKGFVYLHEVDPTIRVSLQYITPENFVGRPIAGYKKPIAIITRQAAEALRNVQNAVKKDGYSLVIYDAYRPQQAVRDFITWSKNPDDQRKKAQYYPRVDKSKLFELGYLVDRTAHSRGSTVDLTLIKTKNALHDIRPQDRTLRDGYTIQFLDDGTIDMGSSFDLFDKASHYYENTLIKRNHKKRRAYLNRVMKKYGFKDFPAEWWHFTLENEPFAADKDTSYFDFPVE